MKITTMRPRPLTEKAKKYIEEHYRQMSDKEVCAELHKLYGEECSKVTPGNVKNYRQNRKLKRTKEDLRKLMDKLVASGVKRDAIIKQHQLHGRKNGDLALKTIDGKKEWCIRLGPDYYRRYCLYLYEMNYGAPQGNSHPVWKDPNGPLTIDNIVLVNHQANTYPIGSITTWKHEGKVRELIKTTTGWQLYLPYLWRLHYGEMPGGMWVEKIDPAGPSEISNLRLTRCTTLADASKNLDDWYIEVVLGKDLSDDNKDLAKDPTLIALQRLKIELQRELKAFKDGKKTRGSADQKLEGPSASND
jgi:hypothetical protein